MFTLADCSPSCLAFLFGGGAPGFWEIMLILTALLLLFGKRLPEVGRSLGRGFVEFKKGLKGVQDEIHQIDIEASKPGQPQQQQQQQQAQQNLPNNSSAQPQQPVHQATPDKSVEEQKTA